MSFKVTERKEDWLVVWSVMLLSPSRYSHSTHGCLALSTITASYPHDLFFSPLHLFAHRGEFLSSCPTAGGRDGLKYEYDYRCGVGDRDGVS